MHIAQPFDAGRNDDILSATLLARSEIIEVEAEIPDMKWIWEGFIVVISYQS